MELCTQTVANHDVLITRRSASHHPTVWGDHFLSYAHLPGANEGEEKQHEDLKEEVRKMLVMAPSKSLQKLDLINTIQRLGVAYHFESEIEESLSYMYTCYEEWIDGNDDLHAIALCFRLLRQQGYRVSCDAFKKFTNDEGNFKNELVNDVHGLLSLYEAAQFRIHGDDILDEALNFSITQLKLILPKLSNSQLAQQVSNALKFSIRDGIVRVEARKYILFYQESGNQVLLNFAKLDFNILQRLHQKELSDLTRWWKELEIVKVLPYARDRLVELYFWMLGVYFEPKYSFGRKILTKISCLLSIIDDTYDIYGTLDELTLLTEAIERWNIDASEQLSSYMKIIYRGLLDVYNEFEKDLANENKSFLVDYSISEMKKVVRGYFQEAKWYHGKIVPTMEEYMKNGILSSGYPVLATTSWLGMTDVATKDEFDWISTEPPILVACCIITRLLNDLASHEEEQKRGDVASAMECYMEECGVTKEEAEMKIRNIIKNNWKNLNEEYLKLTIVMPRVLLMPMINLTRVVEFLYKDEDAYTFSKSNLKDVIKAILIDPINIDSEE